jgi:PIN domain nuclease of toxin-antitoxin system
MKRYALDSYSLLAYAENEKGVYEVGELLKKAFES